MSVHAARFADSRGLGGDVPASEAGPASKRIIVGYGFWIFLLSDFIMFSAFFALVGCHGLHVTIGLLWLTTMMAQVQAKGFQDMTVHRMMCFSLFWHALDIIWVAVFTVVYLLGMG